MSAKLSAQVHKAFFPRRIFRIIVSVQITDHHDHPRHSTTYFHEACRILPERACLLRCFLPAFPALPQMLRRLTGCSCSLCGRGILLCLLCSLIFTSGCNSPLYHSIYIIINESYIFSLTVPRSHMLQDTPLSHQAYHTNSPNVPVDPYMDTSTAIRACTLFKRHSPFF